MKKNILFLTSIFALFNFFITSCTSTKSSQEKTIQQLIRDGKTEEVKSYFSTKTDVNEQDSDGNTVLHIATAMNDSDLVTFLILKGADTEIKNFNNQTPLILGITNDCYESVRALTKMNANVFAKDENEKTALELALDKNEIFYDLMINEQTANLTDDNGQTIIHYFIKLKNEKALNFAIKKNLPIDKKDNNNISPLSLALSDNENILSIKNASTLLLNGAAFVKGKTEYFENAVLARNYSLPMEYGQTPLHLATINNHIGIAQFLIENGAQISKQDINGSTPLHEACRYGNVEIAKSLLQARANVNAEDSLGNTPLLIIMPEKNRVELYKLLLDYKADVNHKNTFGDTFLHIASMTNLNSDILQIIFTQDIDINIRNKKGNTPLATAVEHKLKKQIEFFVANGADIHAENSENKTPFTTILNLKDEKSDDKNFQVSKEELFKSIINSENINSTDSKGNTPLLIAIQQNASLEKINYLINLGSNINARNKEGNSALYYAVVNKNKEVGNLLLEKNADIFLSNTKDVSPLKLSLTNEKNDWLINSSTIVATDGSKNTVLHYASEWKLVNAVEFLIQKGALIDAKNSNGETPLFNASKSNSIEIIDTLLNKGANINTRDQLGSTALHAAIRWNAQESAKKLIERGLNVNVQNTAGKTPLAEAVLEGNIKMSKLLLTKGASPNIYDSTGKTALFDAIRGNQPEVILTLLQYNANPQIQDMDGKTPFHEAANIGNVDIIKTLKKANSNPLSRDKNGNTPLSIAFEKNQTVVKAVLGNDFNIADSDGNTPVHIAVSTNANRTILNFLIKNGYPFDTRNSSGYTPLALAVMKNKIDAANILLENSANPFSEINTSGDNVLTIALKNKNVEMINYIVKYSATKTDVKGNSILHYAAKLSDKETVERLLSFGLDKSAKNFYGETPYDLAINWKNFQATELLK